MRRRSLFIGLVAAVVVLCVWDFAWWGLGVQPVFPWTLKRVLENEPGSYVLVDVRPQDEFKRGHIRGAQNRPVLASHPEMLGRQRPDSIIVVICTSGHLSTKVVHRLNKLGFERVYNLTGGMLGWRLVDGPIVGGD